MEDILIDILKFSVPAIIVFLTAYFLIKTHLENDYKIKHMEIRLNNQKTTLPIRLQAYERLTLFLERIAPSNMIPRLNKGDMSARDLQLALLGNIRIEYEHNLSQQLYVSPEAWHLMVSVKEEIVTIINKVANKLPPNATGTHLSRGILEYFINSEKTMPTQKALDRLKMEVRKIY